MEKKQSYRSGMFKGASSKIFELAKGLRQNMTDSEKILWFHLKENIGIYKFRRQHSLGNYIADFYCHKAKLVIEVDGSIHKLQEIKINDLQRQKAIEEYGLHVIRFTNEEVTYNLE
ncbi:MAG TPA: endonuclease domain-containing protein, partial [Flavisolibacter sp.]|nr:endonuclease domain-containing protein [Flavisolibacter sp.]